MRGKGGERDDRAMQGAGCGSVAFWVSWPGAQPESSGTEGWEDTTIWGALALPCLEREVATVLQMDTGEGWSWCLLLVLCSCPSTLVNDACPLLPRSKSSYVLGEHLSQWLQGPAVPEPNVESLVGSVCIGVGSGYRMVQSGGQGLESSGALPVLWVVGTANPLDTGAPGFPEAVSGRGREAMAPWLLSRLWVEWSIEWLVSRSPHYSASAI